MPKGRFYVGCTAFLCGGFHVWPGTFTRCTPVEGPLEARKRIPAGVRHARGARPGCRALRAQGPRTLLLGGYKAASSHTWSTQTGDAGEALEPGDVTGTTALAPKGAQSPNVTLESQLGGLESCPLDGEL